MNNRKLITALAPIRDNDGNAFPSITFETFEDTLINAAGGWTFEGERSGAWRDPATGTVYHDVTRAYSVIAPTETADTIAETIARAIVEGFHQLAAYVSVSDCRVTL